MRLDTMLVPLFVLVGISFAQETNFPVGPQYLVTTGSPMLLRPIATPSLSLGEAAPFGAENVIAPASESTSFSVPTPDTFLGSVYWGAHKSDQIVARRLETPSMTPSDTAWYMNSVAQVTSPPSGPTAETAGVAAGPNIIQLTSAPMPINLPASILDVGVTGVTDAQALLARGYGVSLGELAAYWKSHKRIAPRVFTNADIKRSRG